MTYRVIIMPRAERDLRTIYQYIRRNAPRAANDWLKRARQAANSLAHYPERCAPAPESASSNELIRQLLFGSGSRGTYRFLFTVVEETVYVLHVRHGSMLPLSPDE
jgi:plasmid stabilization system protein ParE